MRRTWFSLFAACLSGLVFFLAFFATVLAGSLQSFSVWPGSQTKNGYFYDTVTCSTPGSTSYWFNQPASLYGYSNSVDINTFSVTYGGQSQSGVSPTLYYTSVMTWSSQGGSTFQTPITPFGTYAVGAYNLTWYPYRNYGFTYSIPAYIETVVADANVSAYCRFTNYMQLIKY